jgi:peroxiredoxin
MRSLLLASLALGVFGIGLARAEEPKQAPKVVLRSVDGKKAYDLQKLAADGPVLVRLTCACSGCDEELPFFQKLHEAYQAKGLHTVAVFQEAPENADKYVEKKGVHFLWLADPKRESWKLFDAKTMPTNILIDKGGRIVKVLPGCTRDGKNAQLLSAELAKLLQTAEVRVAQAKKPEGGK